MPNETTQSGQYDQDIKNMKIMILRKSKRKPISIN
ncbi:hypothetical protein AF72_00140 [Xylella taiwanensis]|uniref:Uncharacterized protein n=1 Tax=Xylella taiwanensis TaxID=1444770 RepID=Z9JNP4_9GAMM|nr:hypothetical protein AF72_00140 [Xylella taiwanensis]